MTLRFASLLAAAGLAALAAPALAQDGYDPGPPPPLPAWDEAEEYPDDEYLDEEDAWEERSVHHGPAPHAAGYPPEQRSAWLEECRARYHDAGGRARGQVIGGLLGAVAGGVAGSAIAEGGDNLGGTLIGAGVGGLAGAAIGGEVGAGADRDRRDECEAYLLRHEQSYRGHEPGHGAGAWGYHYPYPYPVMWVKVPIVTERRDCGCETVVEERVVEEVPPPRVRRRPADKRVRITK
jgi:hypothetical protein